MSGHPSPTGRAQDRVSSPAKDRRSTAEPRSWNIIISVDLDFFLILFPTFSLSSNLIIDVHECLFFSIERIPFSPVSKYDRRCI